MRDIPPTTLPVHLSQFHHPSNIVPAAVTKLYYLYKYGKRKMKRMIQNNDTFFTKKIFSFLFLKETFSPHSLYCLLQEPLTHKLQTCLRACSLKKQRNSLRFFGRNLSSLTWKVGKCSYFGNRAHFRHHLKLFLKQQLLTIYFVYNSCVT